MALYNLNSTINLTTTAPLTTTTAEPILVSALVIGYICIFVSCVIFGFFNLPVKHFETGDGMFFQLLVAMGIWSVCVIVHWARSFPRFYALPLLGGFFWSTGNLQTVPVTKLLGLGMGQTLNNLTSLIFGWSYARFGWFGIKPQIPSNIWLNYIGVLLCMLSIVIYFFVKVETRSVSGRKESVLKEVNQVFEANDFTDSIAINSNSDEDQLEFYEKISVTKKKVYGTILGILGGISFGATFAPILYVQDNYDNASRNYNDYAFSLASGILLSSFTYFCIYCIFKKNKPKVYSDLMLPSFSTGWMWGIANTGYFVATNTLSQSVAFPISYSGPSVVASAIGLLYKEITGKKNICVLFLGIVVTLVGILCCGLSF